MSLALAYRGDIKRILKDYEGSLVDLTKSIGIQPDYTMTYYYRFQTRVMLNQKQGACEDLKKSIELGLSNKAELYNEICK